MIDIGIYGVEKFKELFKKKDYEKLSVDEQKKFINQVLIEVLKENPRGLTASQLERVLPFDAKTIRIHLEFLTAVRETYSIQIGKTFVYYPNGKLAHYADFENVEIGTKYYSFYDLKNLYGEFIYVQEKEKDPYNTFKVSGGLIIEKKELQVFMKALQDFEMKVESHVHNL